MRSWRVSLTIDFQADDRSIFQQSSKCRNTTCDRSPMPFTKDNPLTRPLRWLNQCMVLKRYAETTIVNVLGRRCERLFCRPRRP